MKPIVEVPRNAFATAQADQSALLIDACVYYQTVYRALEQAQHFAVLSGWQFDSGVPLLRGENAEQATRPVTLLKFLNALCEERPELTIYILAWDFSYAYLSEREWMQGLKFTYSTNPRVRFEWDAHPATGASHHQKFVVVDGVVGFLGGIDICDARWDECDHREHNPQRVNLAGEPCKPYHDVQAALTGDAVRPLVDVFVERWQRATGDHLQLGGASPDGRNRFDLSLLSNGHAQPVGCNVAAFSRTQQDERAEPAEVAEIRELVSDALKAAERLIYIETQYFTSRSIAAVLLDRMHNDSLPKLDIVLCMPHGADSPKEKLALGDTQEAILYALRETARQTGHELRLVYSATCTDDGGEIPTFIHSKLLIVDDQLLMVGSPNLTERSMGLDTEIAVTWYHDREHEDEDQDTRDCVRNVRTRLLAEHAGVRAEEFQVERGLCAKIDELIAAGNSRLRHRAIQSFGPLGPWMAEVFDPANGILKDAPLNGSESAVGHDQREHWFMTGIQGLAARFRQRERSQ